MVQAIRTFFRRCLLTVRATVQLLAAVEAPLLVGSLAFATVMSLVPLLAVSLSAFQHFGGFEHLLSGMERLLLDNLVAGAGNDATKAIRGAVHRVHSRTLGVWGIAGLLLVSTRLFQDIEKAVQKIWGLKTKRPLWLRLIIYWSIIFLGPVLLAVALGAITSIDFGLLAFLPKGTIGFVVTFGALVAIYKWVPACKVSWRPAFWSALLASCVVLAAQTGFTFVTARILNYNKIYGSMASIPIFLLWVLLLWWIGLAGVAVTRCLQEYEGGDDRRRADRRRSDYHQSAPQPAPEDL